MLTIAYGYQKPEDGDRGSTWFPAMETNIQQLADHNHNGTNSSQINPASLDKTAFTTTKVAACWVSDGNGNYHMDVASGTDNPPTTINGGFPSAVLEINDYMVKIVNNTTGDALYLSWVRLTATSIRIFSNDSSLVLLIKYI